jgi:hypothetical protein
MSEVVESTSLEASIASFIVWLARQREPLAVRTQCPSEVERLLHWQRDQRERGRDFSADAYLCSRRARGASDGEIAVAAESIGHFQHYLAARN